MGIKQGGVMMRRGLFLLGCVLFLAGGLCGAAPAAVELRDMDFGRLHPQVRINKTLRSARGRGGRARPEEGPGQAGDRGLRNGNQKGGGQSLHRSRGP